MKVISEWRTDVGRVRKLNEDSVYIERDEKLLNERGELLIVADGMGGHQSGEVASEQAVESIKKVYYTDLLDDPGQMLKKAIEEANRVIFARAQSENRLGMGTTVVAAVRIDDLLYIAHVGDSRLYIIRNNRVDSVTEDHSLVAEQVAAGILTPEQAKRHPYRNIISRAVGTSAEVEVELREKPIKLEDGDTILLCSDGLTEHLSDDEILRLLEGRSPAVASEILVFAANQAGGRDNISVIITQIGTPSTTKRMINRTGEEIDDETEPIIYQRLFDQPTSRYQQYMPRNRSVVFLTSLLMVWTIMLLGVTGSWVVWQREGNLFLSPNASQFSIKESLFQTDEADKVIPQVTSTTIELTEPQPSTINSELPASTDSLSPMTSESRSFIPIFSAEPIEIERPTPSSRLGEAVAPLSITHPLSTSQK